MYYTYMHVYTYIYIYIYICIMRSNSNALNVIPSQSCSLKRKMSYDQCKGKYLRDSEKL